MNGIPAKAIAEVDQAMKDVALDLDDSVAKVREYLLDHDPAEAFMSLLNNFGSVLASGRPDLVAGTAALAIMRLAERDPA